MRKLKIILWIFSLVGHTTTAVLAAPCPSRVPEESNSGSSLEERMGQKVVQLKQLRYKQTKAAPVLEEELVSRLQSLQFFFVPGVMNEWANLGVERYFTTFRRILSQYKVKNGMAHSDSWRSISHNADVIYNQILWVYSENIWE